MSGGLVHLSIVIPAYNEEERIAETLSAAANQLAGGAGPAELIVVDDGSSDQTVRVVAELGEHLEIPLRLLREPHRGKGAAVANGMLAALGRFRMLCDADLAMPFEEVPRFLEEAAAGADVVIGSRQIRGARREGEPLYRHLLGRAFNLVVRLLAVQGIEDTQCGYKLFTAEAARAVFSRVTIRGFAFDVETLFLARLLGLEVREIPILWRHRPPSKVRPLSDSFRMLGGLLRVRWNALAGAYRITAADHRRG